MKKIMCLTCCVCQYWGCRGRDLTSHALNVLHHLTVVCMMTSGYYSFISCKIRMVWLQWLGNTDAAIGMSILSVDCLVLNLF